MLGVGNRNGGGVQLAGCCLAVIGMIYAFYVKPTIKRRRQQAVYSQIGRVETKAAPEPSGERVAAEPVSASWEDRS